MSELQALEYFEAVYKDLRFSTNASELRSTVNLINTYLRTNEVRNRAEFVKIINKLMNLADEVD